jgi:phytoene synthase
MDDRVSSTENPNAGAAPAAGSSFYAAMRILPPRQRAAMFEIYAFCRRVDDIADGDLPRAERSARLADWRRDIDSLYGPTPAHGLEALARVTREFGLKREDFLAVIDGMEMDAREDIRAPAFATLDHYCDCVASAVGRLSVRIFGMAEADGKLLAHHLGRALQLTNILRDVDEDAGLGRLYLPREALDRAGIATNEPAAVLASPHLSTACGFLVEKARAHFAAADAVMARAPRRAVKAPRIMGAVYRLILDRMAAQGWAAPRTRVSVPRPAILWILLRYAFI